MLEEMDGRPHDTTHETKPPALGGWAVRVGFVCLGEGGRLTGGLARQWTLWELAGTALFSVRLGCQQPKAVVLDRAALCLFVIRWQGGITN